MVRYNLLMDPGRAELARRILAMLTHGHPVPPQDALQLRSWAVHPADAMLPLEEIAYRILAHEGNSDAEAAKT